jgi:hypothetical protein
MNKRLLELASQRQRLLEKIESQRMDVDALAQRWQKPLALADMGLGVLRMLRNHPILASGGAAALLSSRRRGMIGRAWRWWRLLKRYTAPYSFVMDFFSRKTDTQGGEQHTRAGR